MTRPPEFDELVGEGLEPAERERLRHVHELLVRAGPPPELSPELEAGPDMLVTYRHRRVRHRVRRPLLLAAAALVVVAGAFVGGYATGNGSGSSASGEFASARVVALRATAQAPGATASIGIGARDGAGNWPMRIVARGLPALPRNGYYEVFLTRNGKPVAPCGSFVVHAGTAVAYLNAPYRLDRRAGWVVTAQVKGDHSPGPVVLST